MGCPAWSPVSPTLHRGAPCHAGDPRIAQGCLLCHQVEATEVGGEGFYGAARFNSLTGSLRGCPVVRKRRGQTFRGPVLRRIFLSRIIPSSKTNHAALQGTGARPCPGLRAPPHAETHHPWADPDGTVGFPGGCTGSAGAHRPALALRHPLTGGAGASPTLGHGAGTRSGAGSGKADIRGCLCAGNGRSLER